MQKINSEVIYIQGCNSVPEFNVLIDTDLMSSIKVQNVTNFQYSESVLAVETSPCFSRRTFFFFWRTKAIQDLCSAENSGGLTPAVQDLHGCLPYPSVCKGHEVNEEIKYAEGHRPPAKGLPQDS